MTTKTDWKKSVIDNALAAQQAENNILRDRVQVLTEERDLLISEQEMALNIKQFSRPVGYSIPKKDGRASYSVAVALASDWHCEERVDLGTVNGLNEFNLEIADIRIKKFFTKLIDLVNLQRGGTDVDTLVLALLGDFITNQIHEELAETNSLAPIPALAWVWDRIRAGLILLRKHGGFKKIIIPCCHGNHGRDTKKQRIKTRAAHSLEWIMYHMLAKEFSEGFEWVIAPGYHIYQPVFDKMFRFHHGDALKYNGGIGGMTIPVIKALAAWDKAKHADVDCFGHWHTSMLHRKFISNGSLIGYGDFSLEIKADFEPPAQQLFLIEQSKGLSIACPIFL